jgi:DNA (cytosine-5)-methyltransferase 1
MFFDEQASGSQYGTGSVASTCSTRDYKDATDLGVQPVCATGPVTHTLDLAHGATEDGTGRGTPIVPTIAFHPTQEPISSIEVTHALGTGSKGGCATAAVATEVTGTLGARASSGGGFSTDFEVAGGLQPTPTMAVRRLLPVECERLQGFPDDHTNIPWKKKPASECPDGPRYKALGNSMAVPVMRWIGERIAKVSALAVNADEQ